MEQEILDRVLSAGAPYEKKEPSEWLDLKSRAEEEKFRKLSADLERRRARKFLHHVEEERKVIKELNNLQRDRVRFEREKQLRQRNSFSSTRERRQAAKKSLVEVATQLPMNEKSFGGSASLAFDPSVENKTKSSQRRVSKVQGVSYGSVQGAQKADSDSTSFPYIDEGDVQRFHKLCKSSSKSECRRWGAAWFYAKKEQDIAVDKKKRWTALLLKAEKEKMRVLSEKGAVLMDSELKSKIGRDGVNKTGASSEEQESKSVLDVQRLSNFEGETLRDARKESNSDLKKKGFSRNDCSLPRASLSSIKESEKSTENSAKSSQRLSQSSFDHILHLFSENSSAQEFNLKRPKRSYGVPPEEINDSKEKALLYMPAISERSTEEESPSASEKETQGPRRKKAVCFLPNLTREM